MESGGWRCLTFDPDDLPDPTAVQGVLCGEGVVGAVGLHAYRCSRVLLTCRVSRSRWGGGKWEGHGLEDHVRVGQREDREVMG